ncbi:MAG TPA: phosphate/phosphite/phosphonate ABC transporter substrate-binding protein [Methylibium sp.]|nr:phosphate/phosphite/phosphonate ABC transporter substrate-binding protein [Methylibium sp.]
MIGSGEGAVRWCVTLVCAIVLGCGEARPPDPAVLRVSALPDQTPERVRAQHERLVDQVCALAQLRCVWTPVPSYEALVDRIGDGSVDLAYFGGVTFAQAAHRHQAQPLAMRDVDFRFTSVILVRHDHRARTLADLRQASLAFGNRNSTSGHFMVRQRLEQQGIAPEAYFSSVDYRGTHDATMQAVAAGEVAAGAVNALVFYQRLLADDPAARELRVVWQTPPYADYVWGTRQGLSTALRQRLADAFLDLDLTVPAHRAALDGEGAAGYVPAFPSDFDEVRAIVGAHGRL